MDPTDLLAIHELLARSAYALDEREVEMLADCFAEEATLTLRIAGGDLVGPFEGRAGIMKLMTDSMAEQSDQRRHVVSNVFVTAQARDGAEVTSNLTLLSVKDGRLDTVSCGLYRDRVIRQNDRWRLMVRHIELDLPY
jgi:3-phenylpropionate/cinnamic acid dioxygenase small subunit